MCPTQNCLEKLGHPQPQTPLKTDNTTAVGIANDTVKQKHSKAIDMQFYWICLWPACTTMTANIMYIGYLEETWRELSRLLYKTSSNATLPRNADHKSSPSQCCQSLFKLWWASGWSCMIDHAWWWLHDDDTGYYAFLVTSTASVSFSSTIQIHTVDPKCTTLQTSLDSCEGVIDPGLPGSQDSQTHPEVSTTKRSWLNIEPLPSAWTMLTWYLRQSSLFLM
jgi:hypothetical protein